MTLVLSDWPDAVAGLLFLSGLMMLASEDWRWLLVNLAVAYGGAAALIALAWPPTLAATVLVAGWMAVSVLGLSQRRATTTATTRTSAQVLRLLAGFVAILLAIVFARPLMTWLPPLNLSQAWGGLALLILGILQVGLRSTRPLWVIAGLLTVLAGFEVVYAALEQSLLLAGLLALIVVALALAGGYLLVQEETLAEDAL